MTSRPIPNKSKHCYWEVCTKFNEADIVARAKRGAIEAVEDDNDPDPMRNLPLGTRSITTFFKYRNGPTLAFTHHYRYPAGHQLGLNEPVFGDGPRTPHDPKWILIVNERWYPRHNERGVCPDCPQWRAQARATIGRA
jgi:hypothetical protein